MHRVAAAHGGVVSNDGGTIRIPADGIAATEHGEWTERLEPRGHGAESAISRMHATIGRGEQPPVRGNEPRAQPRESTPHIEPFERQPQRLIRAVAPSKPGTHGAQ